MRPKRIFFFEIDEILELHQEKLFQILFCAKKRVKT